MRTSDQQRLQVLRRVRDFLQPMAGEPRLAVAYGDLEATIERLEQEGGRQDLHARRARRGTDDAARLARTLRQDLMRPLAQLVRAVAPDAQRQELPGDKVLSVPRGRSRQGLLVVAQGLHDLAKPHEAQLTAAGLPAGHLADLQRAAAALKVALDARAQDYLQRASATTSMRAGARRAVQLLRLLDALVEPMLRDDPGRYRAWKQARRLPRRPTADGLPTPAGDGEAPATLPAIPARVAEEVHKAA